MFKYFFILLLFACLSSLSAQENELQLSGNYYYDFQIASNSIMLNDDSVAVVKTNYKSPFASGAMSAVVPGAGQFFNGDYWKTALFVAVEAAAIYAAIYYDNQGDDATKVFENYANANWSVNQYAEWSRDNAEKISGKTFSDEKKDYYNTALINKEGVVSWPVLNELETDIGAWYSHRLEIFGEQQYYEMIGKYPQFVSGWDDFYKTYPDGDFVYLRDQKKVTPHFQHYTGMRAETNDFYKKAKTAVTVLIINHLLSAAEAAITTNSRNKKVKVNVSMNRQNIGFVTEYYPQMNLSYNF